MGQINLIAGFFMAAVFIVAVISFMVGFANDNNAPIDLENDSDLSTLKTNVRGDIIDTTDNTDSSYAGYSNSTIDSQDETTTGGGFIKSLTGTYSSIKFLLGTGTSVIFGDRGEDSSNNFGIIFTTITTFLVFLLIMYGWKTWKGGSPD